MNWSTTDKALAATAVIAIGAGIIMTAQTASRISERSELMRDYAELRIELARREADAARIDSAINAYEGLKSVHPVPISDLLREVLPDQACETREQMAEPTIANWKVHRIELTFADIELVNLAAFMAIAESKRPPWRIVECSIRALSGDGDDDSQGSRANARLIVEALDRTKRRSLFFPD